MVVLFTSLYQSAKKKWDLHHIHFSNKRLDSAWLTHIIFSLADCLLGPLHQSVWLPRPISNNLCIQMQHRYLYWYCASIFFFFFLCVCTLYFVLHFPRPITDVASISILILSSVLFFCCLWVCTPYYVLNFIYQQFCIWIFKNVSRIC